MDKEILKHDAGVVTEMGNPEIRKVILQVQECVSALPKAFFGDNEQCPLKHSFADGIYMREIFIPKDTLLVGKIHKHSHPNIILKGDVSVLTEEGAKRIKAPCSMISPAGTKRVVYAHEDTVWVTFHVTKSQNLEEIEEEIIAKSYEEIEGTLNVEINKFIDEIKSSEGDEKCLG